MDVPSLPGDVQPLIEEDETVTISMYEASVDVFAPYLGNLSGLLDHASAYAQARNIDASVLLEMRLYPSMYSLRQQVGEANRHANLWLRVAGWPRRRFRSQKASPILPS